MYATPIVFDIETVGDPDVAAPFLEPVEAARNLKDPEKIKADIEQRTQDRLGKLGLDWNLGRCVVIAWWTEQRGIVCLPCRDESDEAMALGAFWQESRGRTLVGFACKQFDLKFLIQRSRLLGVSHPSLDVGRYSRQGIVDLYLELTFNDSQDTWCMRRTLQSFCKRFGIPVTDTVHGKDIAALVATGDWDTVSRHCCNDVELTLALARKLRFVREPEVAGVL